MEELETHHEEEQPEAERVWSDAQEAWANGISTDDPHCEQLLWALRCP